MERLLATLLLPPININQKNHALSQTLLIKTVEEVMLSDNLGWDGENPSYDDLEKIVRQVVKKVTKKHYAMNDGEIEDWDLWENDIIFEINKKLDN